MSAFDLGTIRQQYPALVMSDVQVEVLEDLWASCRKEIDNTTQHSGAAEIIEITAVTLLCQQRLWVNDVAPEDVRRHMDTARSKSLVGYVLARIALINIRYTAQDHRLGGVLALMDELPALAAESQATDADRELADTLLNTYDAPVVPA